MPEESKKLASAKRLAKDSMSPKEFSELVEVSVRTLQRLDKKGKLKARKTKGRKVYYLPLDVNTFYEVRASNV